MQSVEVIPRGISGLEVTINALVTMKDERRFVTWLWSPALGESLR